MTLKEFIEKNPSAVEEAAKCKNLQEFKFEKAFELVKNQNVTQLSEDALNAVSGGARKHKGSDSYFDSNGNLYTTSKGKKA